jgi:hypothetical protein
MSKSAHAMSLRRGRTLALVAAAGLVFVALAGWAAGQATHTKGKTTEPVKPESANPDGGSPPQADTVRILIHTIPPRRAVVRWGRKTLGVIPSPRPLVVVRPRDSGPLDLVVRAAGFLPVHTRAYTFSNSRVSVKLTPPEEKNKLFGYREEPPPPIDGGVPPEPPPAVTAPTP